MMYRSELQKTFATQSHADLEIVSTVVNGHFGYVTKHAIYNKADCRIIHTYARERDAKRALKKVGYVQTGAVWRHPENPVLTEPKYHAKTA